MCIRLLIPRSFCSFLGVSLLLASIGCGKRPKDSPGSQVERQTGPAISDMEDYLEKQQVSCESGEVCPNYIAKIVVVNGSNVKFCTGLLVESDIVATSSSCLTSLLRMNNQNCKRDVHFYFPGLFGHQSERVGCANVIQASHVQAEVPVTLWRDDVSFLKLEKTVRFRRHLGISREGMNNHKNYLVWSIDQVDESNAFIRRQNCEALHNSYVNPLVTKESSPGMVLADCDFKNGMTGGPILDYRGRVRGIISQQMSQSVRRYLESTGLLTKPLSEMVHATSFSCAPTHLDSEVSDERECTKELSYATLDRLREDMLSPEFLFNELRMKFEEKISNGNIHFNFGVTFVTNGESRIPQIFPKCFKNVNSWIGRLNTSRNAYSYEMKIPNTIFKRAMDRYGKIFPAEITEGESGYWIQFSPKLVKNSRNSTVFLWNDSINLTFQKITEVCQ